MTTPSSVTIWSDGFPELRQDGLQQSGIPPELALRSAQRANPDLTLEPPVDGYHSSVQRYSIAILSHLLLIAAWHFFVVLGNVPKFVMPSPTATLQALLVPNYRWMENITVTSI